MKQRLSSAARTVASLVLSNSGAYTGDWAIVDFPGATGPQGVAL